jgi:ubiquinone/menaquinone biosynthesis C-methylase UbiE
VRRRIVVFGLLALGAVVLLLAAPLVIQELPPAWTGEGDRLAGRVGARPGAVIADIGAGTGTMTVEMARRVGPSGVVYATEISGERRDDIREAVEDAGLANVRIVAAGEREANLPDACCDGIFLRNVFHHIADQDAFARSLRRALRTDARVVIIDFAPGALWPCAGGHGVAADALAETMTRAGFTRVEHIDRWVGRMFATVFK